MLEPKIWMVHNSTGLIKKFGLISKTLVEGAYEVINF